jgi:starch phosphorylase
VHSRTWTHDLWKKLYDEYIPGWSNEPELFVRVDNVPDERIWTTHQMAKHELLQEVKNRTGIDMSPDVLTIGFARRATPYKRADLLFRDVQRWPTSPTADVCRSSTPAKRIPKTAAAKS